MAKGHHQREREVREELEREDSEEPRKVEIPAARRPLALPARPPRVVEEHADEPLELPPRPAPPIASEPLRPSPVGRPH